MNIFQLFSLIILIGFIVFVATINIFLINFAPKYKIKLSHWFWAPLIGALFFVTKEQYINSILPLFFLLFFSFEIIFALAYAFYFHRFNIYYFFKQSRKFLTIMLLFWYIIFFVLNLFNII